MALTETQTRTFTLCLNAAGLVQSIQTQTLTEVIRDAVGDDGLPTQEVINREASAPELITATALADLLAPADRTALAAAMAV